MAMNLRTLAVFTVLRASGALSTEVALAPEQVAVVAERVPPKPPAGLPACVAPMTVEGPPVANGEELVYGVDLLGVGVGKVRLTSTEGAESTLYRARVEPRRFLAGLFRLEAEVTAAVPQGELHATQSRLRYRFRSDSYVEDQSLQADGSLSSRRTKNGKTKTSSRAFAGPVLDFLSGLGLVRQLDDSARGCALLYNDGRAFTIWIEHVGRDKVEVGEAGR